MRFTQPRSLALPLLVLALCFSGSLFAAQAFVRQQNLAEMTDEAALIYSGRVLSVTSQDMEIAGGQLPTVTYRIRVDENFKGQAQQKGDIRIATLTVAGSFKRVLSQEGDMLRMNTLPQPPALQAGREYLILANAPNQHGLSNTIGLGQGYFALDEEKQSSAKAGGRISTRKAVNGAGNVGLFRGMNAPKLESAGAALSYDDLAKAIRAHLLTTGEDNDK